MPIPKTFNTSIPRDNTTVSTEPSWRAPGYPRREMVTLPKIGETMRTPQGTPVTVRRINNGEYVGQDGRHYVPQIDLPEVTVTRPMPYPARNLDGGMARLLAGGVVGPAILGGGEAGLMASSVAIPAIGMADLWKGKEWKRYLGNTTLSSKDPEENRKRFIKHRMSVYTDSKKRGGLGLSKKEAKKRAEQDLTNFTHALGYYW